MIKLIVSDLDDTLIHKDDHLPEAIVDLAKTLKSSGVDFTFATGRMPYRAINFANDIGLTVPFVANNGSILYCNGEMVYAKKLYAGLLKDIIERYMQENPEFTVLFSYEDRERPLKVTQWIRDRFYKYPGYSEPLGCGNDVWNQDVHKVYVVDEQRTGSIGRLARELKSMTDVVSCYQYGEFSMEIVADNCSKATGVERLIQLMHCSKEEVMAIGDHTKVYTTTGACLLIKAGSDDFITGCPKVYVAETSTWTAATVRVRALAGDDASSWSETAKISCNALFHAK